jgi:hypothetical protein
VKATDEYVNPQASITSSACDQWLRIVHRNSQQSRAAKLATGNALISARLIVE